MHEDCPPFNFLGGQLSPSFEKFARLKPILTRLKSKFARLKTKVARLEKTKNNFSTSIFGVDQKSDHPYYSLVTLHYLLEDYQRCLLRRLNLTNGCCWVPISG